MSAKSNKWIDARIDRWARVVPDYIALSQAYWERRMLIERGRESGLSLVKIGFHLGLHPQVVAVICKKPTIFKTSPIERYFSEKFDLLKLIETQVSDSRYCPHCGRPM